MQWAAVAQLVEHLAVTASRSRLFAAETRLSQVRILAVAFSPYPDRLKTGRAELRYTKGP